MLAGLVLFGATDAPAAFVFSAQPQSCRLPRNAVTLQLCFPVGPGSDLSPDRAWPQLPRDPRDHLGSVVCSFLPVFGSA